ncbi:type II toxin-antitoxin system RelE/ParE family toxin [Vandammella animalimorsus]|uniref:type II toxin-antitoxin system RelE/ParE family toxin n=1 Tax=Vandammella animalimorsus TaxID=2029117 RepID=UPI0023B17DD6|nr:type II toxin-antitoxin system RelE/ParE family toxin [Vandammella animalimorsus]
MVTAAGGAGLARWRGAALFLKNLPPQSPPDADAVYVLHAFQKKTQKTAQYDLDLAARRYKTIGV